MMTDRLSVLVLDDSAHMRGLLRTILSGFSVRRVEEAADVDRAVTIAEGGGIDVALVDLKLEGGSGFDFCRRIRFGPEGPLIRLPIIMVTAHSERTLVREAINAGVDEFLVKPVSAADVASKINAVFERRRTFIISPDYIGPDRRRRNDPEYAGPRRRAGEDEALFI
jgi:two-component system chemotaxis response regulator CheY